MKNLTILFTLLLFSCENYYDKGKEYTIVESETTTVFKHIEMEDSESCKECHETIYNEFTGSMHFNATVFRDDILNAVWETHPNFEDKTNFKCAKCHLPGADNIEDLMTDGADAMPDKNNATHNEAVSCASCHRIESIEKHRESNINIYSKNKFQYFGVSTGESHAHQLSNGNEMYRTGEMCMGCHSHRENTKDYIVCITDSETKHKSYETCITCHMPQVEGTGTNMKNFRKHFYHGFAGANHDQEMLGKFVEFSIDKINNESIELNIINKSPHDLFLHPLRESFLKMDIIRNGKSVKQFKTIQMERILENEKGIAGCIGATKETKNTLIKGDKTTVISLEFPIEKNDQLRVEFGYRLVKEAFIDKLNLKNKERAFEYRLFKEEIIDFY